MECGMYSYDYDPFTEIPVKAGDFVECGYSGFLQVTKIDNNIGSVPILYFAESELCAKLGCISSVNGEQVGDRYIFVHTPPAPVAHRLSPIYKLDTIFPENILATKSSLITLDDIMDLLKYNGWMQTLNDVFYRKDFNYVLVLPSEQGYIYGATFEDGEHIYTKDLRYFISFVYSKSVFKEVKTHLGYNKDAEIINTASITPKCLYNALEYSDITFGRYYDKYDNMSELTEKYNIIFNESTNPRVYQAVFDEDNNKISTSNFNIFMEFLHNNLSLKAEPIKGLSIDKIRSGSWVQATKDVVCGNIRVDEKHLMGGITSGEYYYIVRVYTGGGYVNHAQVIDNGLNLCCFALDNFDWSTVVDAKPSDNFTRGY